MRVRDCSVADVEAACVRGEILRTHVMRPTWHFVAAADLRWLLRLTGPRVLTKSAGRHRELGLDGDTLARAADTLGRTLADGEPRTRDELAAVLAATGIHATGPRLAHAVMHAELEGVLCSGARRGRQHTYLALDGRAPAAPGRSREDDVAELVLRYFTSHGPATFRDFAWWSGLTIADARTGVAAAGDRLAAEEAQDGTLWIAAGAPVTGSAAVLGRLSAGDVRRDARRLPRPALRPRRPAAQRRASAAPHRHRRRAVGRWTRRAARGKVTIEAALFTPPSPRQSAALYRAVDRFSAFVTVPATLELRAS